MSHKNINNRKFFCDLDGVGADFASARDASGLPSEEFKLIPGAYRNLQPYPGFADRLLTLLDWGWDVWIATKIPNDNPHAATEKLLWVQEHIPFMRKSVIITPNKGTLGDVSSFLIDDRPHKAHCEDFVGTFLRYGEHNEYKDWDQVMAKMALHKSNGNIHHDIYFGDAVVPVYADVCGIDPHNYVFFDDIPAVYRDGLKEFARNDPDMPYFRQHPSGRYMVLEYVVNKYARMLAYNAGRPA